MLLFGLFLLWLGVTRASDSLLPEVIGLRAVSDFFFF